LDDRKKEYNVYVSWSFHILHRQSELCIHTNPQTYTLGKQMRRVFYSKQLS